MQSLSKTRLTFETAQAIVAQHLPGGTRLTACDELTEGFYNAAYRLQLENGRMLALKIAPPPQVRVLHYERNILHTEVEVMRLVKEQTSMPVPAILFYDTSCTLLPSPFFGMEFISGEPLHKLRPALTTSEQAAIDRQTGAYLLQMNSIHGQKFGLVAQPENRFPAWRHAFDHLLSKVLLDGFEAGVNLPQAYADIHALCRAHYTALDEVRQPRLVHWDLWDGNIFVDPQRKTITGIIDFERSLWADPLMEPNFGAFGVNQNVLLGYGMQQPFTPGEQARRMLYNIYLYLIMVIECTYRQYPTHNQETWAREKLAEELKNIHRFH